MIWQVNFEEETAGFSSLEMQVRDWNGTVRLSSTLTPGDAHRCPTGHSEAWDPVYCCWSGGGEK